MKNLLREAVSGKAADYLEVRVEESHLTTIAFQGSSLDRVGQSVSYGGNVRALVNGGWGFASFNRLEDLEANIAAAIRQAELIGRVLRGKSQLAPVPVVEDIVPLEVKNDPRSASLESKVRLLQDYNEAILSFGDPVTSSSLYYFDKYTRLYFANSEGAYIEQEKIDLAGRISAIASRGGQSQQGTFSFGSTNDFGVAFGLQDKALAACKAAVEMLDAPSVAGGEYTVICDPKLAGVFVHEAFGHLSEADGIYENPSFVELMKLGTRFGGDHLNIYDSGLDVGARGYLKYDDEGVATEKTYLIKNGILVGRLHSRETAAKMGERPTGNARAIDYRFGPIVRMRNTCIEAGEATFEDMLRGVRLGIYAKDAYGGQTSGEMFTFSAGEAFMIRDGQIAERVKDVTLSGNLFTILKNIDLIGRDFTAHESAGGCGKNGQAPLPTSEWSPHIRIQNVVIGGKK